MAIFLNPRGRQSYGIGLCDRCKRKFFLDELSPDRDNPGLMVCVEDNDEYDPWKLPPRRVETIHLPFVRGETRIEAPTETVDGSIEPTPEPESTVEDLVFSLSVDDETTGEG